MSNATKPAVATESKAVPYVVGMALVASLAYVTDTNEEFSARVKAISESVAVITAEGLEDAAKFAKKGNEAQAYARLQDLTATIGKHRAAFAKMDGKEDRPRFPENKEARKAIMARFAALEKPFADSKAAQAKLMREVFGVQKEESRIALGARGGLVATTKQTTKISPQMRKFDAVHY